MRVRRGTDAPVGIAAIPLRHREEPQAKRATSRSLEKHLGVQKLQLTTAATLLRSDTKDRRKGAWPMPKVQRSAPEVRHNSVRRMATVVAAQTPALRRPAPQVGTFTTFLAPSPPHRLPSTLRNLRATWAKLGKANVPNGGTLRLDLGILATRPQPITGLTKICIQCSLIIQRVLSEAPSTPSSSRPGALMCTQKPMPHWPRSVPAGSFGAQLYLAPRCSSQEDHATQRHSSLAAFSRCLPQVPHILVVIGTPSAAMRTSPDSGGRYSTFDWPTAL